MFYGYEIFGLVGSGRVSNTNFSWCCIEFEPQPSNQGGARILSSPLVGAIEGGAGDVQLDIKLV